MVTEADINKRINQIYKQNKEGNIDLRLKARNEIP